MNRQDTFSDLTKERPTKGSQFTCLYPTKNNLEKLNKVKTRYLKRISCLFKYPYRSVHALVGEDFLVQTVLYAATQRRRQKVFQMQCQYRSGDNPTANSDMHTLHFLCTASATGSLQSGPQ
jgi:hypothetical protein